MPTRSAIGHWLGMSKRQLRVLADQDDCISPIIAIAGRGRNLGQGQ